LDDAPENLLEYALKTSASAFVGLHTLKERHGFRLAALRVPLLDEAA
jgi:hypothetical protein